ncbi:OmpA family protein [Marinomonas ostreistagni]|uniref:OmpA family protein n=1 Tax=Marinomonas ostreistagni TaxID=359209 RepID=A0ABS0ZCS7_9GAMM|nr:OmpA family protein [Marinomonas ostreistagni]MBJ7551473.1 OmpA family protein [Marinomonas ostreistagni]
MFHKLRMCSFAVLASFSLSFAWSDTHEVNHDDAITSVTQFDQQLLDSSEGQELAMYLSSIRVGDSKTDIDALLGTPYSVEHILDGTRWDYNISVPTSSDAFMGCQYRLEFDEKDVLRSADWRKSVCDLLYRQNINSGLKADQEQRVETFSLLSDVLFSFNQYQLSQQGVRSLDAFVEKILSRYQSPVVTITGYTDSIGSPEANLRLSKWRAREVGKRFLAKGLPQSQVLIKGLGESAPIVECASEREDKALIECLAPNRRVEIEIYEASTAS